MDNVEADIKGNIYKEKREIIILTIIFSAISTFFTLLFEKTMIEQAITLTTAVCFGFFILWWCKIDSLEKKIELKSGFRVLIVLLGAIALIVYLFKSRGFRGGVTALCYLLLMFIGLIITNTLTAAIFSLMFNTEMGKA